MQEQGDQVSGERGHAVAGSTQSFSQDADQDTQHIKQEAEQVTQQDADQDTQHIKHDAKQDAEQVAQRDGGGDSEAIMALSDGLSHGLGQLTDAMATFAMEVVTDLRGLRMDLRDLSAYVSTEMVPASSSQLASSSSSSSTPPPPASGPAALPTPPVRSQAAWPLPPPPPPPPPVQGQVGADASPSCPEQHRRDDRLRCERPRKRGSGAVNRGWSKQGEAWRLL